MTKPPKRPRDLNQWAKRMVDIAIGEASDRAGVRITMAGRTAPNRSLETVHSRGTFRQGAYKGCVIYSLLNDIPTDFGDEL